MKAEIIKQARKKGINPECLVFEQDDLRTLPAVKRMERKIPVKTFDDLVKDAKAQLNSKKPENRQNKKSHNQER